MDETFDSSTQEAPKSLFNSTIAILYRIDDLWKRAHNHAMAGRLLMWNWALDRVWCELAADANKDDKKEYDAYNDKISKIDKRKSSELLYKTIQEKEIFLRLLQNKQGKGVKYEDSISDYMD